MSDRTRDQVVISKILNYCEEIEKTHQKFGSERTLFLDKENGFIYRNAITMPILQIGELVKHLSEEFKKTHSTIPWKAIAGIRDIFAHNYGSIDYEMTWNTSKEDISALKNFLKSISDVNG